MCLYEELSVGKKGGRKSAAINLTAQTGLSQSSIGNLPFRAILEACQIPPPSEKGMQKCTNKVSDTTVNVNKRDMVKICNELKKMNKAKGLDECAPIRAESDVRYNNPLHSKSGAFQAGTQATCSIIDNVTPQKKIIASFTGNKLCNKGGYLKDNPNCDHSSCAKNLDDDAIIGDEALLTKNAYNEVLQTGLPIGKLSTDGDSAASSAVKKDE